MTLRIADCGFKYLPKWGLNVADPASWRGSPGRGVFASPSLALDIALTSRCPLSCRYCSVEKKPVPELSGGKWGEVISSLASCRAIEEISLEGGEPFLHPDLPDVVRVALECAQRVKIVTSGALPCPLPASLALHPRFHIDLSMDGPPFVHNYLRDGSCGRARDFLRRCLERGIQVHLRTVISVHNLPLYEGWLAELDASLENSAKKVGFSFDTLIAPEALAARGGPIPRAGLRSYASAGLLPSAAAVGNLFLRLQGTPFRRLKLLQSEPLRGCRAGRRDLISLDPAGRYSFCCEAPGGFGSILGRWEECLARLDEARRDLACRECPHLASGLCSGCWTGQKCGMVDYWEARDCRELISSAFNGSAEGKEHEVVGAVLEPPPRNAP